MHTLILLFQHLERSKKAIIDETEKGWYITWIEKSEEQKEYEAKMNKKSKMAMADEELVQSYVNQQIEKVGGGCLDSDFHINQAKADKGEEEEEHEATELIKAEDETIKLDMKMKSNLLADKTDTKLGIKNMLKDKERENEKKRQEKESEKKKDDSKRKMSALEEIMEQGKKKQKEEDAKKPKVRVWLRKGIVVKVIVFHNLTIFFLGCDQIPW